MAGASSWVVFGWVVSGLVVLFSSFDSDFSVDSFSVVGLVLGDVDDIVVDSDELGWVEV